MTARHPALPWVVWGSAAIAYAVAIINRSSLAALGPVAQEHFGIDATTLSMFAMIQLLVYAGLQIPVGVLLDRFGPTLLILTGGVLMVIGQIVMATVSEVSLAILARVLVGAGDACTFISVIRLLPDWFSLRYLPTMGQITGQIGQAGQLVSVTPLALVVGGFGWATGFLGVAATGFLVVLLGVIVLRDKPGAGTMLERVTGRRGKLTEQAHPFGQADSTAVLAAVAPPMTRAIPMPKHPVRRMPGGGFWEKTTRLLSIPGVRLAYWLHFTSQFSATVFLLLWGTPFLTGGIGLTAPAAGGLLSIVVIASMISGLLLGPLSSRFVERRVWINFGVTCAVMVSWVIVLLWPGAPPLWVLMILMIVLAIGGPASMIAFEVARSHTPRSFSGFGTGLVNTGGFTASLIVILLIGVVLDLQGAGSPETYSLDAFKWAFAVQVPFWLLGLSMIVLEARRTGRWMRENGRTLR